MAMTRRAMARAVAAVALLAAALFYLRDPPWLLGMTSGLHAWETGEDGRRGRWTSGRASFFVPASAARIVIPVRTTFDSAQDWPIVVTVTVDDRQAGRITLSDGAWREMAIPLTSRTGRRVRRIDIHADRARPGGRAVQIGELRE